MMEVNLFFLHLMAGRSCGEKATCGDESTKRKIKHKSEKEAIAHAAHLNEGAGTHPVEHYPCPFCFYWHVGRVMSMEELTWRASMGKQTKEVSDEAKD